MSEVTTAPVTPAAEVAIAPAEATVTWKESVPQSLVRDTPEATIAELSKAYKSLESKLGQRPKPEQSLSIEAPAEKAIPDNASVADIIAGAGLDTAAISQQWQEKGALTDEQYAAFKNKYGYTKAEVNAFAKAETEAAEGRSLVQQSIRREAAQVVGGEEKLTELLSQAKNFVPADELEDLNQRLASQKHFKGALRDIQQHYQNSIEAGQSGSAVNGSGTVSSFPTGAFASQAEQNAAFMDPRFDRMVNGIPNPKHDPAFVKSVMERMKATKLKR